MTIQKKVARAICKDLWAKGLIDMELPPEHFLIPVMVTANVAIVAFLEAAAEPDERGVSWHMRPDEATEEMTSVTKEKETIVAGIYRSREFLKEGYHAMLAVAPEFEWDK